jgi:hypothetical protein
MVAGFARVTGRSGGLECLECVLRWEESRDRRDGNATRRSAVKMGRDQFDQKESRSDYSIRCSGAL